MLVACSRDEGEESEISGATPRRMAEDGAIHLTDQDRAALDLVVEPVLEAEVPEIATRFGRVRARLGDEAVVVSPIGGRIVRAVPVPLGTAVDAGAPLIELVPVLGAAERLSVGVRGAEMDGQIEALGQELKTREAEAARYAELQKSNIVSAAKLQEAVTAVSTTRAQLDALRRGREVQVRGEGSPMILRSPISGVLATLDPAIGAVVNAGDVLARVIKPGPLWVDVAVSPNEPTGDRYEVGGDGAWIPARFVARGAVAANDGWRHDRVEVGSDSASALLPGTVVRVRVARGVAQGVVVPETALVPVAGADAVYIEGAANTFTATPVQVVARFGGKARVGAGLQPGATVVVQGAMALRGEALRGQLQQAE
jgi:membrane fusion protein (multidrug efflux system)